VLSEPFGGDENLRNWGWKRPENGQKRLGALPAAWAWLCSCFGFPRPAELIRFGTALLWEKGCGMLEVFKPGAKLVVNSALSVLPAQTRKRFKEYHELRYWRGVTRPIAHDRAKLEHERAHYEFFFTSFFGLGADDYAGSAVLDIGCGPCGSLEWATGARERVGLDPLADRYRRLANEDQAMTYCAASSEAIPFPDSHFDCVSMFNSLDHVDDVAQTIREIKRVTAPAGRILLIVEIGHAPTPTEPHWLDRDVVRQFAPEFEAAGVRLFGVRDDHNLYASLKHAIPYVEGKPGVLAARLERAAQA
jgi:SAM-dependent methyltransferase